MKSILTHCSHRTGFDTRLQVSLDVARRFGGHVSVVQPRLAQEYVAFDMVGGSHFIAQAFTAAETAREELKAKTEAMLSKGDIPWDWETIDGSSISGAISDQARLADLVVLSLDDVKSGLVGADGSLIGDVVMTTRTPIMAVPPTMKFMAFDSAAIAYDGSDEAANAVRAAVPLLAQCSKVTILEVGVAADSFPVTDVAQYLARHSIHAVIEAMPRANSTIEEILLGATRSIAPDFLVMGAYGKSRWREALFGGVTRYVLGQAGVPVFMTH